MFRSVNQCGMLVLALASTVPARAQDPPRASVAVGLGNTFGWIGTQVGGYVAEGRVSGFVGLGYMPNLLNDEGDGVAGAVGVRAFTGGSRHRGLIEVSLSVLSNTVSSTWGSEVVEKSLHYGPGVAVGYQFIGQSGVTFLISGGAGWDEEGLDPEGSQVQPIISMGIGFIVR